MPPRTSLASTPRRVTRASSRTPGPTLPALSTRQSHAYGAPGKTTLHTQIATANTDLAAVMGARHVEDESASINQQIVDEEDLDDDDDDDDDDAAANDEDNDSRLAAEPRDETRLSPKAPYAESLISRNSPTAANPIPKYRYPSRQTPPMRIQSKAFPSARQPNLFQAILGKLMRRVPRAMFPNDADHILQWNTIGDTLKSLFVVLFLVTSLLAAATITVYAIIIPLGLLMKFFGDAVTLGVVTLAPFPASWNAWREATISHIFQGQHVPPYNVPTADLEASWNAFKHERLFSKTMPDYNVPDLQWSINVNFLERLEKVESLVDGITTQAKLHNETMSMIHGMLPHLMVVARKDGSWEVPEKFWHALLDRLGAESDEASKLWQAFLKANERAIQRLNEEAAAQIVRQSIQNHQVVDRETVEDVLRRNYAALQDLHSQGLAEVEQRILKDARRVAEGTSQEMIERTPAHRYAKMQAQSLAYTNIMVNTRDAMQEINYFSPGLGASINYRLTSPTQTKNRGLLARTYSLLAGSPENPPVVALSGWAESTDCWCAAPSNMGKAQISIDLGQKTFPVRLIVEHIPAAGTMNIAAAPRELEVWGRVNSREEARRISAYIAENKSTADDEACEQAPTDHHVCLGKGVYDIHQDNWVQSFLFFANTADMGLATDNIIVRVTKNWGAEHTCLYRLRLTGVTP